MMDRKISDKEIKYLLNHLDGLYSGCDIGKHLNTGSPSEDASIYIPLSEAALNISHVFSIGEIPVLFPCSKQEKWYSVDNKRIYFHHDILKSAFYLLSGYQEYHSEKADAHGRYPWKSSIQYKLGITQKPVVNYYFEVIMEAFEVFCKLHGLKFYRKTKEAPVLFLSHDVDRIKKYSLRNLVFAGMQLLRLKPDSLSLPKQLKVIMGLAKGILLFEKDPYWCFQEMTELEDELSIHSTWYFLEKTQLENSKYHFRDKKIIDLIGYLSGKGHEIGIHGTLESSEDQTAMNGGIHRLRENSNSPLSGIRQHFLKYKHPITPRLQANTGLIYDSSLGFAEQIGFRNSYSLPFRLYDFDSQEPMDMWQLPLNVMEVTLMGYMMVPIANFSEAVQAVIMEVEKFKGVLTLLWHNCRLDEELMPGIQSIYKQLLEEIMRSGFISLTGQQAIDTFISDGASGKNW